jgi:F-type H+-transporting ATPase subunit alpha
VAGSLRLELAQYRELAAFSQFASDLDEATKQRLTRGRLLTEVLKQKQYQPMSVAEQVISLMAAIKGAYDALTGDEVETALRTLLTTIKKDHSKLVDRLNAGTKPSDDDVETIVSAAKKIAATYKKED